MGFYNLGVIKIWIISRKQRELVGDWEEKTVTEYLITEIKKKIRKFDITKDINKATKFEKNPYVLISKHRLTMKGFKAEKIEEESGDESFNKRIYSKING